MKLSTKELRKIIKEELNNVLETTVRPKNPLDYVSDPDMKEKIMTLINSDDEEAKRQGYELASMLQDEGGYEGDDYMADVEFSKSKMDSDRLENLKLQAFDKISGLKEMISNTYQTTYSKYLEEVFLETLFDPAGPLIRVDFGKGDDGAFQRSLWSYVDENKKLPDSSKPYTPDIELAGLGKNNEFKKFSDDYLFPNFLDQLVHASGVERSVIENEIMKFIHEFIPNYSVKWQ